MASTKSRRAAVLDGPAPPRLLVSPASRANSWEDVADLAATLGIPLDEWQEQVLESAMGERTDGRWASKFIGLSAPRQNGKSQLIVARALAGVLLFGEKTIIISAHETDTARQVWQRLIDTIEDNPTLEARVTARMNAVNRESLTFGEGLDKQTIKLKARGQSGSRGFSADCLLLDEAQILGRQAWGSIVPTMSARPNPQLWLFGTPPTVNDDPFAFTRVREQSKAHKARHCWLEWSADEGDDPDDPETWAKANPSFGVRLSEEACADDRAAMDDQQFAMERLGMWAPSANALRVIQAEDWDALAVTADDVPGDDVSAFGLDMSHNRVVSIGVSVGDHVEVAALDQVSDTLGAVEWLIERAAKKTPVVVDGQSPAASMVPALRAAGVQVVVTSAPDMAKACGAFYDAVLEERLTHFNQHPLNSALAGARKRPIGTAGGWGWDRKDYTINLAPLVSVTLARFGASTTVTKKPSQAFAF
jgi:hypothetical protein